MGLHESDRIRESRGGAGKTVTARHLAVAALKGGISRVAAIDLDPMRGLSRWWRCGG
ncbi:division plane positioning ATPase MipZ [Roseomonas chloroacetimidivorans]|uniref:nucleotide-binding protein n=1 Tax=Roseomonas chloroacetimidivorans TaxID=1766656 RepID=UPI003C7866AB